MFGRCPAVCCRVGCPPCRGAPRGACWRGWPARAGGISHRRLCLHRAGCLAVLRLLVCVADHVSYVSFGFCATSFQLIVTILIYLFHPSVGFFPVAGWTLVSADLPFQALFLKRDICSFSKPFTGCFSSDLSIASKVSLCSLFATTDV